MGGWRICCGDVLAPFACDLAVNELYELGGKTHTVSVRACTATKESERINTTKQET